MFFLSIRLCRWANTNHAVNLGPGGYYASRSKTDDLQFLALEPYNSSSVDENEPPPLDVWLPCVKEVSTHAFTRWLLLCQFLQLLFTESCINPHSSMKTVSPFFLLLFYSCIIHNAIALNNVYVFSNTVFVVPSRSSLRLLKSR